ncbi:MAG: DUF1211 domain-containing protein [Terrimonas sp.]|nr:DUF1211 domain-containing protein [Terrimonas sp.]
MTKNRLEAFSDGVLAIVITIMVLEMKAPHEASWESLIHLLPVLGSYIISFLMIAIYWGNHHHLMHTISHVNSGILWANTHLLFWLSLIPFATAWMGENNFAQNTIVVYALLLNLCGLAYFILLTVMKNCNAGNRKLLDLLKHQMRKGMISLIAYTTAIGVAFVSPLIAGIIIVVVGIIWLVPDRNIERSIKEN